MTRINAPDLPRAHSAPPRSGHTLIVSQIPSPLGPLFAATDEQRRLCALEFADLEGRMTSLLSRQNQIGSYSLAKGTAPEEIVRALAAYFAGRLDAIDCLTVSTGGTDFQRLVWSALRRIPYGTTVSYGELAATIGRPAASRAVGLANGSNPIGIVVPCHRVIGSNGQLTGYGGGLERKRWLLDHERKWSSLFGASERSDRVEKRVTEIGRFPDADAVEGM
jgi:O-6-methylguanine DNA methyltransferase